MGLPSLDFADTDDDSPLRPIEQNFVRKPVKEVEKNETPRHIQGGWKEWDRKEWDKVGKNGTSFVLQKCVGKNGTGFLPVNFPLISKSKIATKYQFVF